MKILVLGGSGFVGTRLVELLLDAQYQVTIGDLVKSEAYPDLWQHCDVCVDDDLRRVMPGHDCIVNLAASHRDDVRPLSLYTRNNVEGAEHVCKIATELYMGFQNMRTTKMDLRSHLTNTGARNYWQRESTKHGRIRIPRICYM